MEVFNLNIIPGAVAPIIHASQYDEEREFRANLFEGDQVFELTGEEIISVNVRKPDGNVVTAAVVNTGSNYVEFSTTLQMTACAGVNLCQLRIENSPRKIGTLNFILAVERDPLEGGIQSESEIHNLETQVAGMVAADVATQYDSANVIFDNAPTSGHGTPYTVTSEGIKTAIDNAFDYDNTASGSLVHIEDGADNIPVKSLVSEIVAVQSGSGTPSPSNPRAISGFNNGVVSVCGKNLVAFSTMTVTSQVRILDNIYLKAGVYTFSIDVNNTTNIAGTFNIRINTTSIDTIGFVGNYQGRVNKTFTLSQDSTINIVLGGASAGYSFTISNAQIEVGDTATTFEAYNGNTYTFTFGQTVYGGHFDNKSNLVVTHGFIDLGTLSGWSYNSTQNFWQHAIPDIESGTDNVLCEGYNYTNRSWGSMLNYEFGISGTSMRLHNDTVSTSAELETQLNGIHLKYLLANPITLAITSQDIPTLLGENNIFSNCGDVEVDYYTDKANDILDFINSEIDKKNGDNIPIEEDSPDSIKDYIDNGLSGKADTSDLNDKQDKNVLNIVKHYDTGTSSDAITDIITEYGKVNMVFAFDVPLGYFTGCLTFANDNMGSGFIVLSTTGRFWVVSYVSGTITLTELT